MNGAPIVSAMNDQAETSSDQLLGFTLPARDARGPCGAAR